MMVWSILMARIVMLRLVLVIKFVFQNLDIRWRLFF